MSLKSLELKESQFREISRLVSRVCGINLKPGKQALVRSRLMKRLQALNMNSVEGYLDYLECDGGQEEMTLLIDVMTTNKTGFFRENEHFRFLVRQVLPELSRHRVRFWSAACSSGEEPFSLSILLHEHLPDIQHRDVLILATDISSRMLEIASRGVYRADAISQVEPVLRHKYFDKLHNGMSGHVRIREDVLRLVRLAHLNLMGPWPMKGPFKVVFCRNVMIYFDRPTQQRLIDRFYDLLEHGGYLFVGHSEGLSAVSHRFEYVQPAVYRK